MRAQVPRILVTVVLISLAVSGCVSTKAGYFTGRVYALGQMDSAGQSGEKGVEGVYVVALGKTPEARERLQKLRTIPLPKPVAEILDRAGYTKYVAVAVTDESGEFRTPNLPAGRYNIGFYGDESVQSERPKPYRLEGRARYIRLPLTQRSVVRGYVLDENGDPMVSPTVRIQFRNESSEEWDEGMRYPVSRDGRFVFSGFTRERTYRLVVDNQGYTRTYYPSEAGQRLKLGQIVDVKIQLTHEAQQKVTETSVSGRVRAKPGGAITDAGGVQRDREERPQSAGDGP